MNLAPSYDSLCLTASTNNTIKNNRLFANLSDQLTLNSNANNNTISNNILYNGHSGLLVFANNNLFASNIVYNDSNWGIDFNLAAANNLFINNSVYGHATGGVNIQTNATGNTFVDSKLGYSAAGVSLPDSSNEVVFQNTGSRSLILKNSWVNPAAPIDTTGIDSTGTYVLNYSTGIVQVYGDYTVSGATWTFDYATQLYPSSNTTPKAMKGSGTTFTVNSTSDTTAASQLVTMTWDGSVWQVVGSSTGNMGTYSGTGVSRPFPAANTQFMLTINYTTPSIGDSGDFGLIAASQDSEVRKQLLFGKNAAALNQGR